MLLEEILGKSAPISINGETAQAAYFTRLDPLSGNVSKISEARAKRNTGISANFTIDPVGECDFCMYLQKTPEGRVTHDGGAVSVHNKFPWEKYDWITIYPPFAGHKLLLSDLYFDDLERMIDSSFDLASVCVRDSEVIAFMDFTNWGPFAGASQQHPHSQRKSVTGMQPPRLQQEMRCCRELQAKYGRNPFDLLAQEERQSGLRLIHDNDVFIAAAFAPTCPEELIVFPKENIANILQTSGYERKRIVRPVLGIFPALFFYRGVTDLNIAIHMAPFADMDDARRYYRWHMHIYPRRSRLPVDKAGSEIGFATEIIDTLPETTAAALRHWYEEGPNEALVAKLQDGAPNPKLLQAFRHFLECQCQLVA